MGLCFKNDEQKAHVEELFAHTSIWFNDDGDGVNIDDWVSFDTLAAVVDYLRQPENTEKELFEKCWVDYQRKGSKKVAYERWKKLSSQDRQKMVKHIPFYLRSNERVFLKDFERYISNRTFESVVIEKGTSNIIYDPERESGSLGYSPTVGGALSYNEYYKCYMYTGFWDGHIPDGYTDDNRPDGVEITLNNGRGTIVWDSLTKQWNKK